MSVESMAVVLHHSKASGTRKLVLLGIANHEGDGGAWPSVETLARYANVNERSVQRAIAWLVSRGEVRVDVQLGGTVDTDDHRRPNRYTVLVSCPGHCDRSTQHRDTRRTSGRQLTLSTGVTPVSPHQLGGVTPVSPHGVTPVSPKPPTQPLVPAVVPEPQTAREPCHDCGQPESTCQSRQARWPAEDRHPYRRHTHATG